MSQGQAMRSTLARSRVIHFVVCSFWTKSRRKCNIRYYFVAFITVIYTTVTERELQYAGCKKCLARVYHESARQKHYPEDSPLAVAERVGGSSVTGWSLSVAVP